MQLRATSLRAIKNAALINALTLADIWSAGQPGLWYDAGDMATLFQGSAGTTPVTAVTQPVGLMLDKRLGLVRGPELAINGGFNTDVTGWTPENGASSTWVASRADVSGPATFPGLGQFITIGTSGYYEFSFNYEGKGTSTSVFLNVHSVTKATTNFTAGASGTLRAILYLTAGSVSLQVFFDATTGGFFDNISVKLLDGNHALQATAAARPVWSARVNLLIKSEVLSDALWTKQAGVTVTDNATADPDGAMLATQVDWTSTAAGSGFFQAGLVTTANVVYSRAIYIRADTAGGTVAVKDPNATTGTSTLTLSAAWQKVTLSESNATAASGLWVQKTASSPTRIYVAQPQLEVGSAATRYQRVNTASDYDTVGFPFFLAYDGVDDGMSTATFAAGTLGADMDCFIAVRRVSATGVLAYTTAGSGVYLGAIDATAGAASAGAGTPTYVANGVAVPGGTATTRAQLATAVPVGSWVVLEIRNANLSAWTAFATGAYTGFILAADDAQIVVAPAGDAAQRQRIRTYLGAKVGLTL